ncbi:protein MviN [Scardovia inopinata]|uniref:Integral membrane protein MviN n=1 Tax=Scardovia inopinata F0304 TaxID=641146 RepID=W5IHF7_SCAIO|nr:murein biosynthesis integral membrane protein MurJ [Scardovia inopinata]EFG26464.1 integral membrane protein MviN [Scardovia inopinata F0304]BAR07504.1 conserved hypothetical protein [Scardovia inopinata JCM 12537]SUV51577.1 protein MviN [Scardovia inopinata]
MSSQESSVGRNSLIMASGTFFSRLTGQFRTILLAAAVGTTGIAANAYQTGTMIPQVLFTILSGGVFNAVLVPQIVRALKQTDAHERLDKLITLSIVLLLGVTLLMSAATHLITTLYLNSNWNPSQHALVDAFTLWCMPQIFFYGLYTILGQILAAQERFAAYAWSSVGANIISCVGFLGFILLFGNASRRPMSWWTQDKIFLTAGMWTLGIAFQALILFVPLIQTGYRYHFRKGIHGIGLRSMGSVAIWSLSIVLINQLIGILTTRVTNGAPIQGHDLYGIAGNASYQNAFTLYMLPYSLIAVSIATAIFPRLSLFVAEKRVADAKDTLSQSLRRSGIIMLFFTAVFVAIPVPIIKALLPSVPLSEINLICPLLITLGCNLWAVSTFLFLQRTFYAFENGKYPFIFVVVQNIIQVVIVALVRFMAPPQYWTWGVSLSVTISYTVSIPLLFILCQKKLFHGSIDTKKIILSLLKSILAAAAAALVSHFLYELLIRGLHIQLTGPHGHISWLASLLICLLVGIVALVIYTSVLILLKTSDIVPIGILLLDRLGLSATSWGRKLKISLQKEAASGKAGSSASPGSSALASVPASSAESAIDQIPRFVQSGTGSLSKLVPDSPPYPSSPSSNGSPSLHPVTPVPTMDKRPFTNGSSKNRTTMNIRTGDIILNRYELQNALNEGDGIATFMANDITTSRQCQLFVVTDRSLFDDVNAISSVLTREKLPYCERIYQSFRDDGAYIIATEPDSGVSLAEYTRVDAGDSQTGNPVDSQSSADSVSQISATSYHGEVTHSSSHTLSIKATRSLIGELISMSRHLKTQGIMHHALSPQTVRLTTSKLLLADTVVSAALRPFGQENSANANPLAGDYEAMAVRQISAILFQLITGRVFQADKKNSLSDLTSADAGRVEFAGLLQQNISIPPEFVLICQRGLGLVDNTGSAPMPLLTLLEMSALLGDYTPWNNLSFSEVEGPFPDSSPSISQVQLQKITSPEEATAGMFDLPARLFTRPSAASSQLHRQARVIQSTPWDREQLFQKDQEVRLRPQGDDLFGAFDDSDSSAASPLTGHTPHAAPAAYPEEVNSSTRAIQVNPADKAENIASSQSPLTTSDRLSRVAQDAIPSIIPPVQSPNFNHTPSSPVFSDGSPSARIASNRPGIRSAESSRPSPSQASSARSSRSISSRQQASASDSSLSQAFSYQGSGNTDAQTDTERERSYKAQQKRINKEKHNSLVRRRTLAVVLVGVLLIVALVISASSLGLFNLRSPIGSSGSSNPWPSLQPNQGVNGESASTSSSSPKKESHKPSPTNSQKPKSSTPSSQSSAPMQKATTYPATKTAGSVPAPHVPKNTSPIRITGRTFLNKPNGQNGYGLALTFASPVTISRLQIQMYSQGGNAFIYADSDATNPVNSYPLAQFSFDSSHTTNVTLSRPISTDRIVIWVPSGSMPDSGSLHFGIITVY